MLTCVCFVIYGTVHSVKDSLCTYHQVKKTPLCMGTCEMGHWMASYIPKGMLCMDMEYGSPTSFTKICCSIFIATNQLYNLQVAFTLNFRETYHLEPLSRHQRGKQDLHNMVIYKSSDVVYDLAHTACSSMQSPRLRFIQVGWLSRTHKP